MSKPHITPAQNNFFWQEIQNEHDPDTGNSRSGSSSPGGASPATLGSALETLEQCPPEVVAEMCDEPGIGIEEFIDSIKELIQRYGPDRKLIDLVD